MKRIIPKKTQNETMSFEQIAKVLNLPVHQCRIIFKHAVLKMKPYLKDYKDCQA